MAEINMHVSMFDWLRKTVNMLPIRRSILEFGSHDVNGTIRNLFPHCEEYYGIDLDGGIGVNEIADASTFQGKKQYDTVLCLEVLEHTDKAFSICRNAYKNLENNGGIFLMTAAGIARKPHSADGSDLKENEFYRAVTVQELRLWLCDFQFYMIDVQTNLEDVYAIAVKW